MDTETKQLKKEQEELIKKSQELEQQKGEVLTRLIEIQGILKFIKEKEK